MTQQQSLQAVTKIMKIIKSGNFYTTYFNLYSGIFSVAMSLQHQTIYFQKYFQKYFHKTACYYGNCINFTLGKEI